MSQMWSTCSHDSNPISINAVLWAPTFVISQENVESGESQFLPSVSPEFIWKQTSKQMTSQMNAVCRQKCAQEQRGDRNAHKSGYYLWRLESVGKDQISQDGMVRLYCPTASPSCPRFCKQKLRSLIALRMCVRRYSPGHGVLCMVCLCELHLKAIAAASTVCYVEALVRLCYVMAAARRE